MRDVTIEIVVHDDHLVVTFNRMVVFSTLCRYAEMVIEREGPLSLARMIFDSLLPSVAGHLEDMVKRKAGEVSSSEG